MMLFTDDRLVYPFVYARMHTTGITIVSTIRHRHNNITVVDNMEHVLFLSPIFIYLYHSPKFTFVTDDRSA
ncbi:hypothetical protein L1887_22799 [Cichorium endivia]|nr:hypothetical protein L1887_22799 [Cichorium endivia]